MSEVDVDVDLSQEETQPRSRRRKSRLSFTSTTHKPTTEEIEDNRSCFKIPSFYKEQGYSVEELSKTTSVAVKYGIKLVPPPGSALRPLWKCLFPGCFEQGNWLKLAKGTTANATGHLIAKHGIISNKTMAQKRNKKQRTQNIQVNDKLLTRDPARYYALIVACLVVKKNVPLDFGLCKEFAMAVGRGYHPVRPEVVKRSLLEFYVCIKELLSTEVQTAKNFFKIPFIHLSVDVYKNALLNVSFLGIRISFVDPGFRSLGGEPSKTIRSFNLGVRAFTPNSEHRSEKQVSDLLFDWTRRTLRDYGLDTTDVLCATSDSGSDIKRVFEKKFKVPREWCLPHLIHRAIQDAFGSSSKDKAKSKNQEAYQITKDMRRVIEFFNKSPKATQCLREEQSDEFGKIMKLVNFAHQRWSSACRMYEDFLKNFAILQQY